MSDDNRAKLLNVLVAVLAIIAFLLIALWFGARLSSWYVAAVGIVFLWSLLFGE